MEAPMADPRPDRPKRPVPNVVVRATAALFLIIVVFIVVALVID